jgi:AcrR family transcriptional regulator
MLSAALTLMLRQGVRATAFADVVRASGLHEETVRKYAEDIEGVILKVLEDIEQDVIEAMIAEVSKAPATAEAKLGAFIETLTRAQPGRANRMALLILMGTEFVGSEGKIAARTGRLFTHLYRTIEGIIQFGWLRSTFRTDLPVKELTAAFVGALTGTVLEARRMGSALDPLQLDRAVRLVLLRGMEDRIALERVLSGFVAPGYHP